MNFAVASGKPVGDLIVPPYPAKTWIIEEEGTGIDTKSRQRKIQKGMFGEDFWQTDMFNGNLFWTHHQRIKLDNPKHVREIIRRAKEHEIKLITIDAMTYAHNLDENKAVDMRIVADALQDIRAETGATILGIRHTGKQSQREPEDIDIGNRGHSVLEDLYDFHFALRRDKSNDLWMQARYRDHAPKMFNVWWQIESCDEEFHDEERIETCKTGTCAHRCSRIECDHTAVLTINERGADDETVRAFNKNVRPYVQPGQIYTFGQLQDLLKTSRGNVSKRMTEWMTLGLIKEPTNTTKKGWMLV